MFMDTLFLLRHAKSSWKVSGTNDQHRELSERGEKDVMLLNQYLKEKGIFFDKILCSIATRTMQTMLNLVSLDTRKIDIELDLYHADEDTILDYISKSVDCSNLLLIAHNPGISGVISKLSGQEYLDFPTCTLAKFKNRSEIMELDFIIRPKNGKIEKLG